ncbi:MAG: hypothetical protein ABSF18_04360 [Gammaproteobacteria bacterium]|jgi:hypothetical protein
MKFKGNAVDNIIESTQAEIVMPFTKLISEIIDRPFISDKCCFGYCQNKPIISHTIPENFLYKICNDLNKVLMFRPSIDLIMKQPTQSMSRVDKSKFSTFKGFCSTHDHDLFKLIDTFNGEMDQEKAALIHYKNICYGINHIKTQQLILEHVSKQNYRTNLEVGQNTITPGDNVFEGIKDGTWANRLEYCLKEHELRKKILEEMIGTGDFSTVIFYEFINGGIDNPIFCGRSSFLMHQDSKFFEKPGYAYMPWITYMSLRSTDKNNLVFCFLKNDERHANYFHKLINQNTFLKETLLSLIYAYSDSLAIKESQYKDYSAEIDSIIREQRIY